MIFANRENLLNNICHAMSCIVGSLLQGSESSPTLKNSCFRARGWGECVVSGVFNCNVKQE